MLVTLDFETYYDADYTLKKMSTSEYIRDPRFKALSCSIKIGKNKPFCYFGDDIEKGLNKVDWPNAILLAHHTQFDGLILTHHFGRTPRKWADTLSMARALHPKMERNSLELVAVRYNVANKLPMPDFAGKTLDQLTKEERAAIAAYNNGDVQSCYEVYQEMLKVFPVRELDLVDATIRMFAEPVLKVDLKKAKAELKREQDAKAAAIQASGVDIETLSSNAKFVAALEARGVEVPTKDSPTVRLEDGSPKQIPAVAKSDEALQALLTHPDEAVSALVAGRLAAKSTISESRANRLILHGSKGMALPAYYNYAGAHTHRWSGGDKINLQNFKQKKKEGGALRECIKAPAGQVLVVVDAAQIEARVVAWLAGQEDILAAFRDKQDIYCEFASEAYGREITKADISERFVGKTCILGLGYGMGAVKLQKTLLTQSISQGIEPVRMPIEVCYKLVDTYRKRYHKISNLWKLANDQFIAAMISGRPLEYKCLRFEREKFYMPNGLALLYPGLRANVVRTGNAMMGNFDERIQDASYLSMRDRTKIYGGLLVENIVQALSKILIGEVIIKLQELGYRVVMTTHDEVVFLTHKKDGKKALDLGFKLMSEPPEWAPDLPLSADGGFDVCYSK